MPLQTTVNAAQGFGVVGEFFVDSPQRVQSFILQSASAANNVFGRAFSKTASVQGIARVGNSGSNTLPFAGILVNPKGHPLFGDGSNALNPALVLPNQVNAELCTEGSVIVNINKGSAIAVGDQVVYDNTTGVLTAIAQGANLPVGSSFAFATVDYFIPTLISGTTYFGVITISPTLTIPVLA